MHEELLTLGDFYARLRALFKVQLAGDPMARSEYGKPYVTIANGLIREPGEPLSPMPFPEAPPLALSLKWFEGEKLAGRDVIVWRLLPEVDKIDEKTALYMRCHTIKRSDILW